MPRTQSAAAKRRSDELIWIRDTFSVSSPATNASEYVSFTDKLASVLGETPRNWTIERILANVVCTVPAATAAGRSYFHAMAIDLVDTEASNPPEPFTDQRHYPWIDGRFVYADHTVPASYNSPGINGVLAIDMSSKRRAQGVGTELKLFGYHDNGLGANPVISGAWSALFRMR